jgi:hypothetical protein
MKTSAFSWLLPLALVSAQTGQTGHASQTDPEVTFQSFAGAWHCDTELFDDGIQNIQIIVVPSGHGLIGPLVAVVDPKKQVTVLSFVANAPWSPSTDYFPVKGIMRGIDDHLFVEFKDRPVEMRKTSGDIDFWFEDEALKELHILDHWVFSDGSWAKNHAVCARQ